MATKYTCPICGRSYTDPTAMATCASACAKKIKENDKETARKIAEADGAVHVAFKNLQNAITAYKMVGGKTDYSASLFAEGGVSNCVFFDSNGDSKNVNLNEAKVSYEDIPVNYKSNLGNCSNKYGTTTTSKVSDLEDFCKSACGISDPVKTPSKPKKKINSESSMGELLGTLFNLALLEDAAYHGDLQAKAELEKLLDEIDLEG